MKKNFGMFFGLPRWDVGAVVLALCALTPVSRAGVIINNTGSNFSFFHGADPGGDPLAQVFTMSGTSFDSLILQLQSTAGGSASVDLYNVNGSDVPTTLLQHLGTVTTGTSGDGQLLSVGSFSVSGLTSGNQYAIVLQVPTSGSLAWDVIDSAGSLPAPVQYNSGGWISAPGNYFQMDLELTAVPEVPMTGAVIGFGALAIGLGHTVRRKLRPAVSGIL